MSKNRAALVAATMSIVAGVIAIASLSRHRGLMWALEVGLIPLALATVGAVGQYRRSTVATWVAAGGACAFAVLTIWSGGSYFFATAVLLLVSALLAPPTTRDRWLPPLSFLTGATGMCALGLMSATLQSTRYIAGSTTVVRVIDVAPVIRLGALAFVGVIFVFLCRLVFRGSQRESS